MGHEAQDMASDASVTQHRLGKGSGGDQPMAAMGKRKRVASFSQRVYKSVSEVMSKLSGSTKAKQKRYYHGDPWTVQMDVFQGETDHKTTRFAMVDTQAGINIVREEVAEELGVRIYRQQIHVTWINPEHSMQLSNFILLPWCKSRMSEDETTERMEYNTKFYVILKTEEGANFDFILGKPWLTESNAYILNPTWRIIRAISQSRPF